MKTYQVETKHPKGWKDGTHTFTAHEDRGAGWYVTSDFGCSKTYRTALDAIHQECANNVCRVVSVTYDDGMQLINLED